MWAKTWNFVSNILQERERIYSERTHLAADDSPRSTSFAGLHEIVVEPALLSGTHHGSSGIISDSVDIIDVGVEISDRPVILASIEHEQVRKRADLEASPDSKTIVHINLAKLRASLISDILHSFHRAILPDGHPLEVRANGVHLTLIDRNAACVQEGFLSVC